METNVNGKQPTRSSGDRSDAKPFNLNLNLNLQPNLQPNLQNYESLFINEEFNLKPSQPCNFRPKITPLDQEIKISQLHERKMEEMRSKVNLNEIIRREIQSKAFQNMLKEELIKPVKNMMEEQGNVVYNELKKSILIETSSMVQEIRNAVTVELTPDDADTRQAKMLIEIYSEEIKKTPNMMNRNQIIRYIKDVIPCAKKIANGAQDNTTTSQLRFLISSLADALNTTIEITMDKIEEKDRENTEMKEDIKKMQEQLKVHREIMTKQSQTINLIMEKINSMTTIIVQNIEKKEEENEIQTMKTRDRIDELREQTKIEITALSKTIAHIRSDSMLEIMENEEIQKIKKKMQTIEERNIQITEYIKTLERKEAERKNIILNRNTNAINVEKIKEHISKENDEKLISEIQEKLLSTTINTLKENDKHTETIIKWVKAKILHSLTKTNQQSYARTITSKLRDLEERSLKETIYKYMTKAFINEHRNVKNMTETTLKLAYKKWLIESFMDLMYHNLDPDAKYIVAIRENEILIRDIEKYAQEKQDENLMGLVQIITKKGKLPKKQKMINPDEKQMEEFETEYKKMYDNQVTFGEIDKQLSRLKVTNKEHKEEQKKE